MRRSFTSLLTSALIATPLVAATQSGAAAAAPLAAAPVAQAKAVAAKDPYSRFKISVKHTKATKRGGKITYYLKAKNLGPHYADYYWIGGQVPTGVVSKLRWGGPKGTKCTWEGRMFWCWGQYALEKGDTDWLNFQVTLKPGTKGVATAKLGIISYDVDQGMENIDKEELERLGIKGYSWLKTVKTKIVTPPRKPTSTWTPPPPVQNFNPPSSHEESNKKKDT
ncbi:hypothetical protein HII36_05860 [Nonomuraea sp. NN258]|uniref:hypothetical protein n=1 Tax=Nonomuraea antri TaxID=2730852 RepID=UPI001567EF05|nr:hypothetical protein [Nonomuraea antri]NRQ31364.1 hypothetical protein [Nonomuraea antri]